MVSIPPGPHILSDLLLSSPIISGEDGPPPGFAGAGGFEFGVDPNLDPELALALRISMEEEKARQEKETAKSAPPATQEDSELAQAMALSMGQVIMLI